MMDTDWLQELKSQLDRDEPNWFYDWATGDELRQFAHRTLSNPAMATTDLRNAIARRLFHRILNSAMSAHIVEIK